MLLQITQGHKVAIKSPNGTSINYIDMSPNPTSQFIKVKKKSHTKMVGHEKIRN